MPYKFVCIFFVLILTICTNVYADTLKLEGLDEKVDVKILEMNEEFVKVIVFQKQIGSIGIKSEMEGKYQDSVFINVDGNEKKVICKIVKITKNPGSITLQIPRDKVSAIQIAFPGSEQDTDDDQGGAGVRSAQPAVDAEKLKEQIMAELMLKFEKRQEAQREALQEVQMEDEMAIEERIKEELMAELEGKEREYDAENYGRVTGRMLYRGEPLQGCSVKIKLLEKWGIFGKQKESLQYEAITDENGRYIFNKVASGGYKISWKPPGESSWIRSIKMEPDIFVETGETYNFRDRETNIKTIN